MEIKHTIKLSSGKTIELTEQEYQEMIDQFKTKIEFVPYPTQPYYPDPRTGYPWWGIYPPTYTSDTLIFDSAPEY